MDSTATSLVPLTLLNSEIVVSIPPWRQQNVPVNSAAYKAFGIRQRLRSQIGVTKDESVVDALVPAWTTMIAWRRELYSLSTLIRFADIDRPVEENQ